MQHLLQDIVVGNIFAFMLIFMRLGMAMMIMPGIGDSFVPQRSRLLFALAFSFVLMPFLAPRLPAIPDGALPFAMLMIAEALTGIFMGTVMRIMVNALDTAGTVVSMMAGYSNATLFNPATQAQGTMTGTLYSMLGVALILMTDMHHFMLASIVESYQTFPANGHIPGIEMMSETIGKTITLSFRIGVQMAMPFLVVGTIIQIGFGLLGRLLPQVQVFFLAMPVQIFLSLVIFALTLSTAMMYWLDAFDASVRQGLGH